MGACIPAGDLAETNETSWYVQARTVFAKKIFGGRVGSYYGDTVGHGAIAGGRVYGGDMEALARFGGRRTFGYLFAGVGYGRTTFTRPGAVPGSSVRQSQWDWSMQGGVGVVIKKIHLEAIYVQYQTNPKTSFIPVVLGFQF